MRLDRAANVLFAICATCAPLVANAQLFDRLYRLLNGDSTQGPGFDTAFVESYRDDLVLSPVMVHQGSSLTLSRTGGKDLRYTTNTPVEYGLALDYKWLGLEYSTSIPGLSQVDGGKGPTETTGLGFGYTGRRWWFRNSFRWSRGYHVADPGVLDPEWAEDDPYPQRGDMESLTYMASLNHGFNADRYSHTAALWQMERQKRSAGSWMVGGAFWFTRNTSSAALDPVLPDSTFDAPSGLSGIRRWVWSVTGGYTHTFAFWQHGFVNTMLVPGIGAQHQRLSNVQDQQLDSGWGLAGTLELRISAGYSGHRWYAAISAYSYQSTGSIAQEVLLGNGLAAARFAVGYRIKGIRPLLPALGL